MGLEALFGGDPRQQGILAAAAQILQASGPSRTPTSFGQILGGGMMAGQQATYEAQQRAALEQMRRVQMEEAQLDLQGRKDARALRQQIDGLARDSYRTAGQQAASLPGGPTNENAARIGEFQDGFDVETFLNKVSAVAPLQAMEYRKMFAKAGPKFDAGLTFVNGPDGRPVAVRTADDGSHKILQGLSPREKLHFLNTGGKTLGVNEYTGEQGASYTNTASASDLLAAATQRRGQDMTDARMRDANEIARGDKLAEKEKAKAGQVGSFETMLSTLDRLGKHPGLSRSVGLYSRAPTLPGTDSANFQAELDTFKSQAFLPMVEQLKGMGALSNAEGMKLTAAVGALDPRMSEDAFKTSIKRIQGEMGAAYKRVAGKDWAPGRTVTRTGTLGGRKVVQYSDGSTEYAD